MNYEDMLNDAYKNMPESVSERERFEIPRIQGHVEGSKTVLANFKDIMQTLRRPMEHGLKFILRELATPGTQRGNEVILGSKTSASIINEKIKKYADEFVFCNQCGKPDTDLVEEKAGTELHCRACGSKRPVKSLK